MLKKGKKKDEINYFASLCDMADNKGVRVLLPYDADKEQFKIVVWSIKAKKPMMEEKVKSNERIEDAALRLIEKIKNGKTS